MTSPSAKHSALILPVKNLLHNCVTSRSCNKRATAWKLLDQEKGKVVSWTALGSSPRGLLHAGRASRELRVIPEPHAPHATGHRPTGSELCEQSRGSGSNRSCPQSGEPQGKSKVTSYVWGQSKQQFKNKVRNKFSYNIVQWKKKCDYVLQSRDFFPNVFEETRCLLTKMFPYLKTLFPLQKKKHNGDLSKPYLVNVICLCSAFSIWIIPLVRYSI